MNLREELSIDKNNLDTEWLHLPLQIFTFNEMVAEADEKLKKAKLTLQRVEARLVLEIKSNPRTFFNKEMKPTEMLIRSAMVKTQNWKKASMDVIKAEKERKEYQVALNALEYKRDALKALTSLYTTEYFNTPRSGESGSRFNRDTNDMEYIQSPDIGSKARQRIRPQRSRKTGE